MSCSSFDLKGYFLGELAEQDRRPVEEHVKACRDCREELERLGVTEAALRALPEEELPRRIAFVSDKVFEPRWWQWLWDSAPRLGFAAAAVLSVAIMVHALIRPPRALAPSAVDTAAIEARLSAEVNRRVQAVIEKATAESEALQARRTAELVAAAEKRLEFQRRADLLAVEESFSVLKKQMNRMYMASNDLGGAR